MFNCMHAPFNILSIQASAMIFLATIQYYDYKTNVFPALVYK